ncbi:MAG: replication protein [Blastocatellia bacterium]
MAKKDRKLMQELLSKALEPPRKPMAKERLDSLLEDYDDGQPFSKTITPDLNPDQFDLDQKFDQKNQSVSLDSVASLAKSATQAMPVSSLDSQTSLDSMTNLTNNTKFNTPLSIDILSSLKNVSGYLQLPNTLIDSLFPQLSPDETVTYLHLYRLSWGFNNPTCIISLPTLGKRTNISPRQVQRVLSSLESKSLIKKEGSIFGKGQVQGTIFRIAKLSSLDNLTRLDSAASLVTLTSIKIDDDDLLKTQDHHHAQPTNLTEHEKAVMMIYQEITGNVWSKIDSSNYQKIKNVPIEKIEIAIRLAYDRATNRPNSFAFFIKEILSSINPKTQSRTTRKKAMAKIVERVRNASVGSNISPSEFVHKVKEACLREDVAFDNDLFEEVTRKT